MAARVMVLPSPLLPPSAYAGLRDDLRDSGTDVRIAGAELGAGQCAADLVRRWAQQCGPDTVIVAHSNAGYLAPLVRATSTADNPIVFMDAALPPVKGDSALAPPGFRDRLGKLADSSGLLPQWTRWWPRDEFADVIPAEQFEELDNACPQLPLSYFDARLTAPARWASGPNAYLAFGDTYREERLFAQRHDWPNTTLVGAHLHFLSSPGEVTNALLELATRLDRR